jgi:hypothetical protein
MGLVNVTVKVVGVWDTVGALVRDAGLSGAASRLD